MQTAMVVVIKDEVVDKCYVIVATDHGIVSEGKYGGLNLSGVQEKVFYDECRRINSKLPEYGDIPAIDDIDVLDELPNFDDGYYIHEGMSVCMCNPTKV